MTRYCTILKNSNRLSITAVILSFLFALPCYGQFRNQEDIEIVKDVLKRFGKECPLRAAVDEDIVKRLEIEYKEVRLSKNADIQKCYEGNYSQLIGVFHLYKKLCDDVAVGPKELSQTQMARQLIDISKYQTGIRTFHSLLNDCLIAIPEKEGKKYLIPLPGNELDTKALLQQIQMTKVRSPYPSTIEPFR